MLLHVVEPPPPVQRHAHRVPRRQRDRRFPSAAAVGRGGGGDEVDGCQLILRGAAAVHVEHGEGGVARGDGALVSVLLRCNLLLCLPSEVKVPRLSLTCWVGLTLIWELHHVAWRINFPWQIGGIGLRVEQT